LRLSRKFGGDLRGIESEYYGPRMHEWLKQHTSARRDVTGSPNVRRGRLIKAAWRTAPDDQN
jgi:hypothetical protein